MAKVRILSSLGLILALHQDIGKIITNIAASFHAGFVCLVWKKKDNDRICLKKETHVKR